MIENETKRTPLGIGWRKRRALSCAAKFWFVFTLNVFPSTISLDLLQNYLKFGHCDGIRAQQAGRFFSGIRFDWSNKLSFAGRNHFDSEDSQFTVAGKIVEKDAH